MSTKNCVCVHIGQGGLQLGHVCWELFCAEHGIQKDGTVKDDISDNGFETFFQETIEGQLVPRALMIDSEPSVIDAIRTSAFRDLYHPELFLNQMEDSASNFARGKLVIGRPFMPEIIEKIRMVTETCDTVQGFMIMNSYGGGTGTGLGSMLAEKLCHEYSKQTRVNVGFFPGQYSGTSCTEPYNSLLFVDSVIKDFDVSVLVENDRLYQICKSGLSYNKPNYMNINRLVSQVVSSLTANLRFDGELCGTLDDLRTNLVPFPNLCFPVSSYAPIINQDRLNHSTCTTDEFIKLVFSRRSLMIECPLETSKQLATCMFFRGDFCASQVNSSLSSMKQGGQVRFVDWCPTGFKLSLIRQPPTRIPSSLVGENLRGVLLLCNTSAVHCAFQRIRNNVKNMLLKRAFFHWYENEGMELDEFRRAYEEVSIIELDYLESGKDASQNERGTMAAEMRNTSQAIFSQAASAPVASTRKFSKCSSKLRTIEGPKFHSRLMTSLGKGDVNGIPSESTFYDRRNFNQNHMDYEEMSHSTSSENINAARQRRFCRKCERNLKIFSLRKGVQHEIHDGPDQVKKILCSECRPKLVLNC